MGGGGKGYNRVPLSDVPSFFFFFCSLFFHSSFYYLFVYKKDLSVYIIFNETDQLVERFYLD